MARINCKGIRAARYNGPTLVVNFVVPAMNGAAITRKVRLNNPRKTRESVLLGVCADIKATHPSAKLRGHAVVG